jgi:hypothetical protein
MVRSQSYLFLLFLRPLLQPFRSEMTEYQLVCTYYHVATVGDADIVVVEAVLQSWYGLIDRKQSHMVDTHALCTLVVPGVCNVESFLNSTE